MNICILFPIDLYNDLSYITKYNIQTVYLAEDIHYFKRPKMKFNILKPVYHRATMKCYFDFLKSKVKSYYIECDTDWTKIKLQYKTLYFFDPVDRTISDKINKFTHIIINTPRFILSKDELDEYKGVIRQTSFYIWIRKKYNILMDSNKPYGGKMTYDKENRKRPYSGIEKDVEIETDFTNNKYVKEAFQYIKSSKSNIIFPEIKLKFPINREDTLKRLIFFVNKSLDKFGSYQDVMIPSDHSFIFHSGFSVMMNIGLITPKEIIDYVLDLFESYSEKDKKKNINTIEGFIRQIIGWREFTRFMYEKKYTTYLDKNYFNANNKLSSEWYTATTGIIPIDHCISKAFRFGYLHHIERLMLVSNYMVLKGISPTEMFKWFTEFSLDSYDWVMEYNVYCMASYSDGGQYISKPYISSSNYVLKMSTYKKGEWSIIWDELFWKFMKKHTSKIKKIHRLSPLLKYVSKHL